MAPRNSRRLVATGRVPMRSAFVSESKQRQIEERMKAQGVRESDIDERFILGTGRGGQKINKTASCVQLRHGPTGIVVKCQRERSRSLNRYLARRELCDRIDERVRGAESLRQQEAARIRRQKRRRSRRQLRRMIEDRHKHSAVKKMRRSVTDYGD